MYSLGKVQTAFLLILKAVSGENTHIAWKINFSDKQFNQKVLGWRKGGKKAKELDFPI